MATQTQPCIHFPVNYDFSHNIGKIITCEEIDGIDKDVMEALGCLKRPKNGVLITPKKFQSIVESLQSRMDYDFKFDCYRLLIKSNESVKPCGFLYLGVPAIEGTPTDELSYLSLYKCKPTKRCKIETKSSEYELKLIEPIGKYNDTADLLKKLLVPYSYDLWTDKHGKVSKPRILDSKEAIFHMLNGILPRSYNEQVPKRGSPGSSVYT